MIIKYLSDLHLEFIRPNKIKNLLYKIKPNGEEVCVLAGDIGNPYQENYNIFMQHINNNFKKSFVITGNHEYYNNNIEETNKYLENYFTKHPNISFLNNKVEHYENYYFIGSTLWSKITKPQYKINDVYYINNFDYKKYNKLNEQSVHFIRNSLKKIKGNKTVIITHHVPSEILIDTKYKTSKMNDYNQWFYCDMDNMINEHKNSISCWIYGHTHTVSYNRIHNIPFICNPIGYPNENNKIDYNKTIDLHLC